jgi:hypothetical protein
MIYCESFGVPLFVAGVEKSCDSAVRIIEITVFRGLSEHYLKVWEGLRTLSKVLLGVLEHYAKFEGGI